MFVSRCNVIVFISIFEGYDSQDKLKETQGNNRVNKVRYDHSNLLEPKNSTIVGTILEITEDFGRRFWVLALQ